MNHTYHERLIIALNCTPHGELLGKVYSAEEAAFIAGCDTDTLANKAAAGDVPGIKWGRSWRYPALAFHLSLNLHASTPKTRATRAESVGSTTPAANDPAPAGRRKPRAAPVLPDMKNTFQTGT